MAPIEEFPVEKWDQIIAINLSSAFHAVRAAGSQHEGAQMGRIINMASARIRSSPRRSRSPTSRPSIGSWGSPYPLCVKPMFGITCNCISPGYVWTPLVEKQIPDTMKARNMTEEQVKRDVLLSAQPTKEFVTVDQVAALAVDQCSDAAAQITGANLSIDGGWTAQ